MSDGNECHTTTRSPVTLTRWKRGRAVSHSREDQEKNNTNDKETERNVGRVQCTVAGESHVAAFSCRRRTTAKAV